MALDTDSALKELFSSLSNAEIAGACRVSYHTAATFKYNFESRGMSEKKKQFILLKCGYAVKTPLTWKKKVK